MALWTDEQVARLNAYQHAGTMHPFTCPVNHVVDVKAVRRDSNRILVATPEGWRCPTCDYTQDWAHGFMLNWPLPDETVSRAAMEPKET